MPQDCVPQIKADLILINPSNLRFISVISGL